MPFLTTGNSQTGGTGTDYLLGTGAFGDGPNHVLTGANGNDFLIGDYGSIWRIGDHTGNDSIANARGLNNSNEFSTAYNPLVMDSAIPHATVLVSGEGEAEYFSVFIGAGETITVDTDFATFDTVLQIMDAAGTDLARSDDGQDPGSIPENNANESYLTWTATTSGTYYIRLGQFNGANSSEDNSSFVNSGDIVTGNETLLLISITGQTANGDASDQNIGNDFLNGGNGNDQLFGMGGDDGFQFLVGDGNDYIDGGDGQDYLELRGTAGPATIDLNLTTSQNTGTYGFDTFVNIEAIYGSLGNDTFSAHQNGSLLFGSNGDDTLIGRNGNDTLGGGLGADTVSGGDGNDNIQHYIGDTTAGDSLDGGDGIDLLTMFGQSGAVFDFRDFTTLANMETIYFAAAAGGEALVHMNSDQFNANNFTTVSSEARDSSNNVTFQIYMTTSTLDLSNLVFDANWTFRDDIQVTGTSAAEMITGTTNRNNTFDAGGGNDILVGGDAQDFFDGGAGNDELYGGASGDFLEGGGGSDDLFGGDGFDFATYSSSTNRVIINMATNSFAGGHATGDTFDSIEGVTGSQFGDTITGDGAGNVLRGNGGNDVLSGFSGNDTIEGGSGNDFITGGAGADRLFGGSGNSDVARYVGSNAGVNIDLGAGTASGGHAEGDLLVDIEFLFGSSHNDVLSGDHNNNWLFGDGGNDTLDGAGGIDKFFGGAGSDTFTFSAGDQFVFVTDFEDDVDTIDLSSYGFNSMADALANISQFGAHTRFFNNGETMLLLFTDVEDVTNDIMI